MEAGLFEERARALIGRIARYFDEVERFPVRARVEPGAILAALPEKPPEHPEPFGALLADFERIVLPGVTHWQHPRFLAYFPANADPASALGEILTAGLAVNAMLWQTSPAATEMEQRVLDWLRQAAGLPEGWCGVVQSTASEASLCALLVARERATGWRGNEEGLAGGPRLVAYASEEAHSSIEKGAMIAGYGRAGLRKIPVDDAGAMRPDALETAIRADLAAGLRPACVVATLGSTGIGGMDPLRATGEICRAHGLYLHVDAAWAGSALLLDEWRHLADGAELADSFVFNPHKWLGIQLDFSAHYVREPELLRRTLSVTPFYLTGAETGRVVDYRDYGIPLGRRFRALKAWFVLRLVGLEGLRATLRRHIALARELAGWIDAEPDFERVTGPSLALLTFRYRPPGLDDPATLDELNQRLVEAVNADGRTYVTPTRWRGRTVVRACVGQTRTERRHVEESWRAIVEVARAMPL